MDEDTDLQRELAGLRRRVAQLEQAAASGVERAMLRASEELGKLGAFFWDAESDTARWSPGLPAILGVDPRLLQNTESVLALVHPDDRKRLQRLSRLALRGGDVEPTHFRLQRDDDTVVHVVGQLRAEVDDDGRVRRLRGALMDETERRQMDEQRLQARKMEAVGTLAGGAAHDFNNLLQVVEGHLDLVALDPNVPPKTRFSINEINASVTRCRELIERLLAFGQRQQNNPTLNDVRGLVGAAVPALRKLLGDDIELLLATDPDACLIRIDPIQFEQVLGHLTANAKDAMPDGGTLEIRVERLVIGEAACRPLGLTPGMYCRVRIRDSGCGMTDEVAARAFEPFYSTKTKSVGTGLGLSIVHGIVHQTGGVIHIDTAPDAGTCFTLMLPASASEPLMAKAVVDSREFPTGTETIMLVEDGQEQRAVTQSHLERAGYNVVGVADGESALEQSEQFEGPIHLLITDVMMPKMSGPELAGRLQQKYPTMPVVFMSGYTERFVFRRASLRSDRVSLHKPFSIRELLACVREQLDALRKP